MIARKLMGLVSGHYLLKNLDGRGLATLLTAIGKNIDKNFAVLPGADLAESEATAKRIGGALSRKTRAAAQDALGQVLTQPRIDLDAYVKAVPFTENRMGLLLAGAFDAAARLVARDTGATLSGDTTAMVSAVESSPQLADLVSFAVSDEYFQARQVLRLAIDT